MKYPKAIPSACLVLTSIEVPVWPVKFSIALVEPIFKSSFVLTAAFESDTTLSVKLPSSKLPLIGELFILD